MLIAKVLNYLNTLVILMRNLKKYIYVQFWNLIFLCMWYRMGFFFFFFFPLVKGEVNLASQPKKKGKVNLRHGCDL